MNKLSEKPFVEFMRVIIASLIVMFIVLIFVEGDYYKSIWAGCFIFLFYYMHGETMNKIMDVSKIKKNDNIFFTKKFISTTAFSVAILILTTIMSGLIYSFLVGNKICAKNSFFYSAEQCVVKKIKENYFDDNYYDQYDY